MAGEIMEVTSLPISMQNIWLLQPPTMSPYPIDPGLWFPVAAAALSAMHHDRKVMYATKKTSVTPPPQTPSIDRRASQVDSHASLNSGPSSKILQTMRNLQLATHHRDTPSFKSAMVVSPFSPPHSASRVLFSYSLQTDFEIRVASRFDLKLEIG